MNSMEEKLWNYIDGTLPDNERVQIDQLLHTNVEIRQQYEELLALNTEFAALELDEPPMAFAYHVMEEIRNEEALVPLKTKVDKRIIYSVAGFFMLTIVGLLILIVSNLDWSLNLAKANIPDIKIPVNLTITDSGRFFTSAWLQYFVCFDIVIALFLADSYLRRKAKTQTIEKINVQ